MDFFITEIGDWDTLSASLIACSEGGATAVEYVGDIEDATGADDVILVVVSHVSGMASYALQLYSGGLIHVPDDALAMHIALATGSTVIFGDETLAPTAYLACRPDGSLAPVTIDGDRLEDAGVLVYRDIEAPSGSQ